MSPLSLSGLWIYPVKSLGGIALLESVVEERGLQYDRRWMVVDDEGQFLTQRQHPRMATLRTSIGDDLCITALTGETVQVPLLPAGPAAKVRVWRDDVDAVDSGDEAAILLSDVLGISCRLVGMTDASERLVDFNYARSGEMTSFADGFPFLVLGQASLDDLNDRLLEHSEDAVGVERFRPNFLFRGGMAYEEDTWVQFRIGEAEFEVVKPCARCVMTTVDQERGETTGPEPLRTLATYRRGAKGQGVCFAQNALARSLGVVRVGDAVAVGTSRGSS